jgi:hypothetical protein
MKDIIFEENGFIFKATSFDTKTMLLHCNQFDKQNIFIQKRKLTFAELPTSIKKKLNPLK